MELKNKRIAFLGDSITEGIGATDLYGYVNYVAEYSGAECVNYGISGTRYARQQKPTVDAPSFDLDFCMRAKEDLEGPFDAVVIFGGTNDYGHGDAPFGTPDDRTPETFYGAAHTLYQTVSERFPESTILVLTPIFRIEGERDKSTGNGLYLHSYVEVIKEVAAQYRLPVLDLYWEDETKGTFQFLPEWLSDDVHPNDEGHKILAKAVISALSAL